MVLLNSEEIQMKDFKIKPEVEAKLRELVHAMHGICVENGIPYMAAFISEDDAQKTGQVLSAYCDSDETPAPNNLIAAIEIFKAKDIPDGFVMALAALNSNGGECDCEECRAERAAAAH